MDERKEPPGKTKRKDASVRGAPHPPRPLSPRPAPAATRRGFPRFKVWSPPLARCWEKPGMLPVGADSRGLAFSCALSPGSGTNRDRWRGGSAHPPDGRRTYPGGQEGQLERCPENPTRIGSVVFGWPDQPVTHTIQSWAQRVCRQGPQRHPGV